MADCSKSNKRIAKNTLMLYIRMAFLMCISFYTSRVVLDKLGIEDFGIQNVVGGLAWMFVFFRSSLSNATQRFLSMALGNNDMEELKRIFSQHQTLYVILAAIMVILAEVIGLWLIYYKLSIPPQRLNAAFWVFQFTILSLAFTVLTVAYDSVLIAREDMDVYAYIGIFEGVGKLLIAFAISVLPFDRLITFSFLSMLISIGVFIGYKLYCSFKYLEAHFSFRWNKDSVRKTFSFISWNVVGTIVFAINDQGVNILLNMFFGPLVNAARGIACHINQALNNFSTNFYTAVRPQIMKSYASGDYSYLFNLVYKSSKYSLYLLWYLSLPLMLCIDAVLDIWLVDVPDSTATFTIWVLLYSLVNSLNNPIWSLALAIGKLKWYIIIGNIVFLLTFPISYVALKLGGSPICVFVIALVVRAFYIVVVFLIVKRDVPISGVAYLKRVILPAISVIIPSSLACIYLKRFVADSFLGVIEMSFISVVIISIFMWILGIDQEERVFVKSFVRNRLHKK